MFEPHGGQKLRDEGERGLKAKLARLEEDSRTHQEMMRRFLLRKHNGVSASEAHAAGCSPKELRNERIHARAPTLGFRPALVAVPKGQRARPLRRQAATSPPRSAPSPRRPA